MVTLAYLLSSLRCIVCVIQSLRLMTIQTYLFSTVNDTGSPQQHVGVGDIREVGEE